MSKRPAYKSHSRTSSLSIVEDVYSEIDDMASEIRGIVDNASEGLQQTQRLLTLDETASSMEGISLDCEIPDDVRDGEIFYSELIPARKGRGISRSARRDNMVSILEAARDCIAEKIAGNEDTVWAEPFIELSDNIGETIETLNGCEYPGMFS